MRWREAFEGNIASVVSHRLRPFDARVHQSVAGRAALREHRRCVPAGGLSGPLLHAVLLILLTHSLPFLPCPSFLPPFSPRTLVPFAGRAAANLPRANRDLGPCEKHLSEVNVARHPSA
eukprot:4854433-Pleurochrysis_carterae.AAC.1